MQIVLGRLTSYLRIKSLKKDEPDNADYQPDFSHIMAL